MRKPNNRPLAVAFILSALLIVTITNPISTVQARGLELLASLTTAETRETRVAPELLSTIASMDNDDMITVIVTMRSQADLSNVQANSRQDLINQVITILKNKAEATQRHIRALLDSRKSTGEVADYESFWVFNGLAVTAKVTVIEELAARPEISTITPNEIDVIPDDNPRLSTLLLNPEGNLSVVNAPDLWDLGYQGQGIVVASMDSGVDYMHPDLSPRWRGGNNSWFDPYGEHPNTPTDLSGHGTWTTGAMVGGDSGGTSIGVAPGAQWIAAKIFDDSGSATAAGIHAAFQWALDPDGDPGTADTPHVVNNSWSYAYGGCDLEFELDLQSLRAAGILPVFAAGNGGPSALSSRSPANNPSALAVGATTDTDAIYFESSRGPSSCGEPETIFPEMVAPGVDIYTSDLYALYYSATGTSLAAPHVSGALALLLSYDDGLNATQQQDALLNGAADVGAAGPDNDFGYGRLDVLASYQWLLGNGEPTPTPTSVPAENLALGKAVIVSSSQDSSHGGDQAVDGDINTYWQSKKVRGRNAPSDESIEVDLASVSTLDQLVISWHDYFATAYEVAISDDYSSWNTLYITSSGDGGSDTVPLGGESARYVRVKSTAWTDDALRSWIREVEVYGAAGSAPPPDTPTPTSTPTPTPTPSPTPDGPGTMHAGDLDGTARNTGNKWKATVTITVHDSNEMPVAGAGVTGTWNGGYEGQDTCTTDELGQCSLSTPRINGQQSSVTFSVDDLSLSGYAYASAENHDADGDSDGSVITVSKP